jgi:hypothetical protein
MGRALPLPERTVMLARSRPVSKAILSAEAGSHSARWSPLVIPDDSEPPRPRQPQTWAYVP